MSAHEVICILFAMTGCASASLYIPRVAQETSDQLEDVLESLEVLEEKPWNLEKRCLPGWCSHKTHS